MACWPCTGSPDMTDVSAELDDIIKRLASGDPSSDPCSESGFSETYHLDNNNETDPDKVKCPEKCVVGENKIESGAENVCGVENRQRYGRPSFELTPTINTDDVRSREPRSEACLEKACSAGSYARRKHHKHHKHKHRSRQLSASPPPEPEQTPKSKINPVFVWVRQEECRIVEVMCEDYDRRNRLRLAKTPSGWRAIPKTEVFSNAVIPKVPSVPKSERRRKRRKSCKKKRKSKTTSTAVMKQCTVALDRIDEPSIKQSNDESDDDPELRIRKEVQEEILELPDTPLPRMTKSSSCEFPTMANNNKEEPSLVRSSSLNFSITSLPLVQSEPNELIVKNDPDEMSDSEKVLDMTKHGDLNDNDCDELGLLLKEIPDLEFVEERDIGDDEFEKLALPKDLTLPKRDKKLPILPPNISPLVTVTSSPRPPQPLTAPLPEVTITPIPNPMPAHQNRPQNKYLESLLMASRSIKPERNGVTITRTKATKRPFEGQADPKAKHVKIEDITLKNLLSKQSYEEKARAKADAKSRLHDLLTTDMDPIVQLKQVLSNPEFVVPDPLLVPRARLPALVASPASEIPRLLMEKKIAEPPRPPVTDPDMLVVSLSHLRSLLAYKCNNTEDISAYQKSLEAFLEWQRYQTELMEAQIKANTPLTPGDIDMATANAFNQMLWLPYLNQIESNRDLMNILNSVCSPYGQSSPFLTPTSPIEEHMKTLAMWQEAMMGQGGNPSPMPPEPSLKIPNPANTARRRGPNSLPFRPNYGQLLRQQQQAQLEYQRRQRQLQVQQQKQTRQRQEQHFLHQQQQMLQNYNNFHDQVRMDFERKSKQSVAVKPVQNLLDKREQKKAWCQFEEDLKKNADLTSQMALQWQQFEEEMRKSQIQITKNQKKIKAERSSEPWACEDNEKTAKTVDEPKAEVKDVKPVESGVQVPKLKVKNLVDPNMSPPKLLKTLPPEHLTPIDDESVPDDGQSPLWHPLFGSNQIKGQAYNSPWRWTTVTVNGE